MDVFVYQWVNRTVQNGNVIIGFGYTEEYERICFIIEKQLPYFYVDTFFAVQEIQNKIYVEQVEKKLIRNFLQKPKMLYKVYFSNMEEKQKAYYTLLNKNHQVYHNDITPSFEYISNKNLKVTGWIHIQNFIEKKENKISTCSKEIIVKNIVPCDKESILDLGILSMDIETYSNDLISFPNKYDPRDYIFSISIVFQQRKTKNIKKYIIYQSKHEIKQYKDIVCLQARNEVELMKLYFGMIKTLDPDIIIGFNTFSYDYDYIIQRWARYPSLTFSCSLLKDEILQSQRITSVSNLWNGSSLYNIPITGRCNIDVYQYVIKQMPHLPVKNLNFLAKEFLNKEKFDLPYKQMFEYIQHDTEDEIKIVFEYCVVDSELTLHLFEKFVVFIGSIEMGNMNTMNIEEYYTTGSSAKFRNVLYDIGLKNNIIINGRYKDLGLSPQGAYVFEPIAGFHKWVSVIDFNSLYPSILIAYNLCYSTYLGKEEPTIPKSKYNAIVIDENTTYYFLKEPMGFVPKLCYTLLENRKKFKKKLKEVSDPTLKTIYDQRQNVTKIIANSIYGCYGSGYAGIVTFREAAECITALGRKYLNDTKNVLEKHFDVTIVYGDTDSCMVRFNSISGKECITKTIEMCDSDVLTSTWPEPMAIKYELLFSSVVFSKKKKYCGIKFDPDKDTLYVKGTYRGTICKYTKHVHETVIRKMLMDEPKQQIKNYLSEVIRAVKAGEIPISNFIFRSKTKQEYKSKTYHLARFKENMKSKNVEIHPGELLELVYTNPTKILVGDKIELVKNLNNQPLDYKHYLEKQIFKVFKTEFEMYDYAMYQTLLREIAF
jgi:DNA polymerase elongation subunit (family B)